VLHRIPLVRRKRSMGNWPYFVGIVIVGGVIIIEISGSGSIHSRRSCHQLYLSQEFDHRFHICMAFTGDVEWGDELGEELLFVLKSLFY